MARPAAGRTLPTNRYRGPWVMLCRHADVAPLATARRIRALLVGGRGDDRGGCCSTAPTPCSRSIVGRPVRGQRRLHELVGPGRGEPQTVSRHPAPLGAAAGSRWIDYARVTDMIELRVPTVRARRADWRRSSRASRAPHGIPAPAPRRSRGRILRHRDPGPDPGAGRQGGDQVRSGAATPARSALSWTPPASRSRSACGMAST